MSYLADEQRFAYKQHKGLEGESFQEADFHDGGGDDGAHSVVLFLPGVAFRALRGAEGEAEVEAAVFVAFSGNYHVSSVHDLEVCCGVFIFEFFQR